MITTVVLFSAVTMIVIQGCAKFYIIFYTASEIINISK